MPSAMRTLAARRMPCCAGLVAASGTPGAPGRRTPEGRGLASWATTRTSHSASAGSSFTRPMSAAPREVPENSRSTATMRGRCLKMCSSASMASVSVKLWTRPPDSKRARSVGSVGSGPMTTIVADTSHQCNGSRTERTGSRRLAISGPARIVGWCSKWPCTAGPW